MTVVVSQGLVHGIVWLDDDGRGIVCTCLGDRTLCHRADCPHAREIALAMNAAGKSEGR